MKTLAPLILPTTTFAEFARSKDWRDFRVYLASESRWWARTGRGPGWAMRKAGYREVDIRFERVTRYYGVKVKRGADPRAKDRVLLNDRLGLDAIIMSAAAGQLQRAYRRWMSDRLEPWGPGRIVQLDIFGNSPFREKAGREVNNMKDADIKAEMKGRLKDFWNASAIDEGDHEDLVLLDGEVTRTVQTGERTDKDGKKTVEEFVKFVFPARRMDGAGRHPEGFGVTSPTLVDALIDIRGSWASQLEAGGVPIRVTVGKRGGFRTYTAQVIPPK